MIPCTSDVRRDERSVSAGYKYFRMVPLTFSKPSDSPIDRSRYGKQRSCRYTALQVQCGRAEEGCVDSDLHAFVREMTEEEIADMWSRKGKRAANQGTEGHYLAELFFNGLPTRWWEGEMGVAAGDFRAQ